MAIEFRDEGVILSRRAHGESAVILDVFTSKHGRQQGVLRGGTSRKMAPHIQPGNQVSVAWSARLPEHLGTFRLEPIRSRAGQVMGNRTALEALNTTLALITHLLPEREPAESVYPMTEALLDLLGQPGWEEQYLAWEMGLLTTLGFGLDLSRCAATGARDGLIYISPKSGQAVSEEAGAPYRDRLLPFPTLLGGKGRGGLGAALKVTGYFLADRAAPALGRSGLPDARARLISLIQKDE